MIFDELLIVEEYNAVSFVDNVPSWVIDTVAGHKRDVALPKILKNS